MFTIQNLQAKKKVTNSKYLLKLYSLKFYKKKETHNVSLSNCILNAPQSKGTQRYINSPFKIPNVTIHILFAKKSRFNSYTVLKQLNH